MFTTFSLIYPHLVIFTPNCPNLTIYAIFTLHRYSASETVPLCKIEIIYALILLGKLKGHIGLTICISYVAVTGADNNTLLLQQSVQPVAGIIPN